MPEVSKEVYFKEVLKQMPRIVSLLDRNISSETYGCFDREHWNYSTSDIAQTRKQEAVLTLALLYKINREDNPYYKNDTILEWINAAINFWAKIQQQDGSFNNLYPNEHSFVATAFSSYSVSETLLQLDNKLQNREKIIFGLEKAARWLRFHKETHVWNQECGAAISLYNISLLTKNMEYEKWAGEKINQLIKSQSKEGWFYEYGGADIGYLSLSIDYLAKFYQKTKDRKVMESLQKAVDFITYFIHPNYTFGGIYGSRNTEYLIPHGFEILSKDIPNAQLISYYVRKSLDQKTTIAPFSLDDKYLLYLSYTYLQAYLDANENAEVCTPIFNENFSKNFDHCGIYIFSNKNFYLIVNYKKGGVVKLIFKQNGRSLNDGGIIIQDLDKKNLTSCWVTIDNKISSVQEGLTISGYLRFILHNKITPWRNLFLRGFQMICGKSEYVSSKVKEILRNILILKTKKSLLNFGREISINEQRVRIIDEIDNYPTINKLIIASKSAFIYGESSNYFQLSDLDFLPIIYNRDALEKFKDARKIRVIREYDANSRLVESIMQGVQ
jgi:hypothetical protein